MVKGMSVEEAGRITNQDIAEFLGGLPQEKMHCSVMGREALEKAIHHYKGAQASEDEGKIVCECFGVTDREIEQAIRENHLRSVEEVTHYTKAGGGCGHCHDAIQELLDRLLGERAARPSDERPRLSNIKKIRMIEETIQHEIRPSLKLDGGDIELVDVIGNRVQVALRGTCASCQAANRTLKDFVETKLRELVVPELVVEEVSP
jgi:NifU-like protein